MRLRSVSVAVMAGVIALLLVAGTVSAAVTCPTTDVKTVKTSGGDFSQITSCLSGAPAGRTCVAYAGSYNAFTIPNGTAGNAITVCANPGDTVTVPSVTLGDHTALIGLTVQNHASPNAGACVTTAGTSTTDFSIIGNTITECGSTSGQIVLPYTASGNGGPSSGLIRNNTISWGCSTAAAPNVCPSMQIAGGPFLVEGNDLSHNSDGIVDYAHNVVYRRNTMHDVSPTECGTNSSNCHIDFIDDEPTSATTASHDELVEGNYLHDALGSDAHGWKFQADGSPCASSVCQQIIIRLNHAYAVGSYWTLDQNAPGFDSVSDYNNTITCLMQSNGTSTNQSPCANSPGSVDQNVASYFTSTGSAFVNNIVYKSLTTTNSGMYYAGTSFRANNNLAFCSPTCTFTTPYSTEAGRLANTDPLFVNAASDWHLQGGSPALNAGADLTTASGAGASSTTLVVTDADYFQDGLGLTASGVQADWLLVGGTAVQIASIAHSTNTITLATAISWANGAAVNLYKDSDGTVVPWGTGAPHVGAFGLPASASTHLGRTLRSLRRGLD